MREIPEDGRDSHTFVCFFAPNAEKAVALQKRLADKGVPSVYFKDNLWHYLPKWEHMLEKKTIWPGPHPFGGPIYGKTFDYTSDMLPQSDSVLERLVVMPVFLNTDEERMRTIVMELESAAEEVL